jgi:hypothetical protein
MARSHNKKRNVGIIYELLLRHISDSLINNDKKSAQKALRIVETRFDKATEIYREFRLFNALAKSTVSDTSIAAAILTEAKSAARRCNVKQLDREKSLLIRDINHNLRDKSFYYRRVPDYSTMASIQNLLNEWRKDDASDLASVVISESKIVEWLLSEKESNEEIVSGLDENVDSLVVKIMTEKINNKYSGNLSSTQKRIIKEYVILQSDNDEHGAQKYMTGLKSLSQESIESLRKSTSNKILLEKIDSVAEKIDSLDTSSFSDDTIVKFLMVSDLNDRIEEEINGK